MLPTGCPQAAISGGLPPQTTPDTRPLKTRRQRLARNVWREAQAHRRTHPLRFRLLMANAGWLMPGYSKVRIGPVRSLLVQCLSHLEACPPVDWLCAKRTYTPVGDCISCSSETTAQSATLQLKHCLVLKAVEFYRGGNQPNPNDSESCVQ